MEKYDFLRDSHIFVPLGFETSGAWDDFTKQFVRQLPIKLPENMCDDRSKEYLTQQFSILIQRGNAASVFGTVSRQNKPTDFFLIVVKCTP